MNKTKSLFAILLLAVFACTVTAGDEALKAAVDSDLRAEQKDRDQFRKPYEVLQFFGIKPDMTVVEIWPGGGWYTNILAPYLKENGTYIAAGFDPEHEVEYFRKNQEKFAKMIVEKKDVYGDIKVTVLNPPLKSEIAEDGSADMVLTFRNVHNWMRGDGELAAFKAFYRALKPGGVLGVVEHRGDENVSQDPTGRSGYVNQSYVIKLAELAGFKLVEKSEMLANPKDTKNWERGVWTLPPVLALGDADRDKYVAVGESDRMLLKFVKPE